MSDAVLRKRLPIPGLGTSYLFADRKSTRLNSSHLVISYAVFCLKKKTDLSVVACLACQELLRLGDLGADLHRRRRRRLVVLEHLLLLVLARHQPLDSRSRLSGLS